MVGGNVLLIGCRVEVVIIGRVMEGVRQMYYPVELLVVFNNGPILG